MRHKLHYEWGLYKSKNEKSPLVAFRLHHECASPLIKILTVIGIMVAMCATACAITSLFGRLCHRHACRCEAKHLNG
jgi:hypothetical protein